MAEVRNRVYMNSKDVPVRKAGESDTDFEARMEHFRKNDLRIVIAGKGKVNFGFTNNFIPGAGVINNGDDRPRQMMIDGVETKEYSFNPYGGSSFSFV